MKKIFSTIAACFLIFILVGCNGNGEVSESVKIGVILPLTGPNRSAGQNQLKGIEMVVSYINDNGGIKSLGGAMIELEVRDTQGDAMLAIEEIGRLIGEENVSAICGPYNSAVAAATAPIAIKEKVPYVIVNAVADNVLQFGANKYVYRTNFGSHDMSPFRGMVVEYLASLTLEGRISKIAVVYEGSNWGSSDYEDISGLAESMGIEVAVSAPIEEGTEDFSRVIEDIKDSEAQLVFAPLFLNEAIVFTKQMSSMGCTAQLIGLGNGFSNPEYIAVMDGEAENVLCTTAFNPSFGLSSPQAAALYTSYLEENDNVPMPEETANGWCGMGVIIEAIEAAGSAEREAIADALFDMDLGIDSFPAWYVMFDGIKFDTDGDSIGRYNQNERVGRTAGQILQQVQGGHWQLVWPLTNKTADINF